jgi:LacI family transcriptional regulator
VNSEEGLDLYADLVARGTRFVVVDVPVPGFDNDFVGPDNREAGRLTTQYLFELGHRRIAWLRGYPAATNAVLREQGYRAALARLRIRVDEKLLAGDNFGVAAGEAAVEELLRRGVRFTGIAASTDLQACGAIRALHRHGLAVPGDVSVVGCSNLDFSALHTPAITSVDQKPVEVGRLAALRLIDRIEGCAVPAGSALVAPELVVRDSTARYRARVRRA